MTWFMAAGCSTDCVLIAEGRKVSVLVGLNSCFILVILRNCVNFSDKGFLASSACQSRSFVCALHQQWLRFKHEMFPKSPLKL